MPKPITPLVGCDVFVTNSQNEVLLIRRTDNGMWALPGGCQNLGETPMECARRECKEESGFDVEVTAVLGVFSSQRYKYVNYPWTDLEFCHLVYAARVVGGAARGSEETSEVAWFSESQIPPLTDGHDVRIRLGFEFIKKPSRPVYFE